MSDKMKATFFVGNPSVWITDGVPTPEDFRLSMADVVLEVKAENVDRTIKLGQQALAAGLTVLIWAERGSEDWRHHRTVREALAYGEDYDPYVELCGRHNA